MFPLAIIRSESNLLELLPDQPLHGLISGLSWTAVGGFAEYFRDRIIISLYQDPWKELLIQLPAHEQKMTITRSTAIGVIFYDHQIKRAYWAQSGQIKLELLPDSINGKLIATADENHFLHGHFSVPIKPHFDIKPNTTYNHEDK